VCGVPAVREQRRGFVTTALARVLGVVAAAYVAVSVLPAAGRLWWMLDLLTHFRLQYAIGGLLLLAALVGLRSRRWALAVAAGVVLNAVPLRVYWPEPVRAATLETAGSDLRVLAANLSQLDYPNAPLLELVRTESPDLLLLVEFTPVADERFRQLDELYPHRLEVPRRDAFGMALYSRHPFTAEAIEIVHSVAIRARVAAPGGEVTVFGVHLRSPTRAGRAAERNRQLVELTGLTNATAGPVIVIGDLNITPFSPFFRDWLDATGLHDAGAGRGPWFSWPTFLPIVGIPIDHCLVSPELRILAHRRLPAFGSDHYPVLTRLRLP
jgi:endonuclease/exonuclease/phosphatase (EEP) superfamily protein YafD